MQEAVKDIKEKELSNEKINKQKEDSPNSNILMKRGSLKLF